MNKIKRLYLDIETSPNIVYSWNVGYKLRISYENIIQERKIICVCYKWEGEQEIHTLTWNRATMDDKGLVAKLAKVMEHAVEIVGHNGDNFDLKWLRTRALVHGVDLPQVKSLDTLKLSRAGFRFNSNRLDYIAKYLDVGNKIKTDFSLWKEVMAKDPKALDTMTKYCRNDVVILERVFAKLEPYGRYKTHVGVLNGGLKSDCPRCGSFHNRSKGRTVSAAGYISLKRKCSDCGRRFTVSESVFRRGKG